MTRLPDLRRAERLAYRVLAASRITSLPVEPLPILRACRDTRVLTCQEAADGLNMPANQFDRLFDRTDAVTYRSGEGKQSQYLIIYQPGGNPARLRFTLAHELGHRLLGHTGADAAEEREADHFASHLLCPEPVVLRLREQQEAFPAELAARVFYVSPACARMLSLRPASRTDPVLLTQVADQLSDAAKSLFPKGE